MFPCILDPTNIINCHTTEYKKLNSRHQSSNFCDSLLKITIQKTKQEKRKIDFAIIIGSCNQKKVISNFDNHNNSFSAEVESSPHSIKRLSSIFSIALAGQHNFASDCTVLNVMFSFQNRVFHPWTRAESQYSKSIIYEYFTSLSMFSQVLNAQNVMKMVQ